MGFLVNGCFYCWGSHQFFEELLLEKGALEEFSDKMSIISLMAHGTTFNIKSSFRFGSMTCMSWPCTASDSL